MQISWRLFLLCIYSVLVGMTFFWFLSPLRPFVGTPIASTPTVDAFMQHATAFRYNQNGLLQERLFVEYWEHFSDGKTTRMREPALSLYRLDGTTWHVTAKQGIGHYSADNATMESVDLDQDVHIAHYPSISTMPDWSFETEHLVLYASFAQTDLPIRVHGPNHLEMDAIGLKAYLDTRRVEFLHQVRSYYAINP